MPCSFKLKRPWPYEHLGEGCQFGDIELETWEGRQWCSFHLPLVAQRQSIGDADGDAELRQGRRDGLHNWISRQREVTGRTIDLSGVQVFDDIDLSGINPFEPLCAAGAHFGERVKFDGVAFGSSTSFVAAEFDNGCTFKHCRFGVESKFDRAVFHAPDFYGAIFNDSVVLRDATFVSADFTSAQFGDWCEFAGSRFSTYVGFRGAAFAAVHFDAVQFEGLADFTNAHFDSTANFRAAVFGAAPSFHGCKLHADITFPDERGFPDTRGTNAAGAYRVLKKGMEELRAHEEQALFHALEQRSRRHQRPWYDISRVVSAAYDKAGRYGQSFVLPLAWIGATFASFSWLLVVRTEVESKASLPSAPEVAEALLIVLRQTFRPFEILGRTTVASDAYPFWLQLVGVTYSLAILSLFALFLVALRRRFKLD